MTLNQLNYFIEIHQTGSMQKAAEKLSISQSTLSAAIKNLEEEFSTPLFDRTPQGLRLNEAGRALYLHAQEIRKLEQDTVNDMRCFAQSGRMIRFGMPPILSLIYWPELWIKLRSYLPDHTFESFTETRATLIEMLLAGHIDMAVLAVAEILPLPSGMNAVPLIPYNGRTLTLSVKHPLANRESLTYTDIAGCDILSYRQGASQSKILKHEFAQAGVELEYKLICSQLSTLISLVRKNAGVAFLNPKITQDYSDLVTIPLSDHFPPSDLYLVWAKHSSGFRMPPRLPEKIQNYFRSTTE